MSGFEAPGPGRWRRDASRLSGAITPYMREMLLAPMRRGFRDGWQRYGAPLERMDVETVAGRLYMRVRPIGAPDQPKPPPPRFIFKLLFAVHPELRRRRKRADEVLAGKLWRDDVARWRDELGPRFRDKNRALQAIDPASLDDAELVRHLGVVGELWREGIHQHLVHSSAHMIPVGELLVHASRWTGQSVATCASALTGSSPASAETVDLLDRITAAIRGDASARAHLTASAPADERLRALRAGDTEVARAFDTYLDEHGHRVVTGFDLTDQVLLELPALLLATVAARLEARHEPAGAFCDPIRERVPAAHRSHYDELLEEARMVCGVRDDGVGVAWLWPQGLVRRALNAAADRLTERGALTATAHVFETTPDELTALLGGGGPPAAALEQRARERAHLDALDPPLTLGEDEPPPPDSHFPPGIARMQRAVTCYLAHFDSDAAPLPSADGALTGHPVSGGVYEGRARVVRGPHDFARIEAGDVLVAHTTSPAYNVLLPLLGAVVTDRGGCLCHAAIVAREYRIPGVVGCCDATLRIDDGSVVRVDGDRGTVEVLRHEAVTTAVDSIAGGEEVRAPALQAGGRSVPLREAREVARFGGKATSLGASLREDLPVPGGVALDVALTESIAAADPDALAALREAVAALRAPFAVRSSAVGEDSATASFAGQHLTILGVADFDELVRAVTRVWASGRSQAALGYRKRMGIDGEPEVAVVVQELIEPTAAGVLFTKNPVSGADECVIEATWGLGEAVVAGTVTPDHFRVRPSGEISERRAGDKDVAIRPVPGGGTAEVPVDAADVHRLCLDDGHLAELLALARRCERVFGAPQDIEWARVGDRIYLLQSRAVTT